MKIQSINPLYLYKNTSINNKIANRINNTSTQDTFITSFKAKEEKVTLANNALSKHNKLGIKVYKNLSLKEKLAIHTTTLLSTKEQAKETVKIAKFLKNTLDKEYGKNKYVFVSIGTSPACIGRAMEFMGVETKYLPISELRFSNSHKEEIKNNWQGQKAYSKFLKSQGIDRETIAKNDKTYLFYDFTASGRTLSKYKEVLSDFFDIPVNHSRIKFISINEELTAKAKDNIFIDDEKVEYYISKNMASQDSYEYAGVPHLNYGSLEKIEEVIKKEKTNTAKRFDFIIITELLKKGLLKNNPLNETSI